MSPRTLWLLTARTIRMVDIDDACSLIDNHPPFARAALVTFRHQVSS
jgi:hypothetical protein